jgi:carboxypeptidase family protein/TonB-dependent receptor-like protein
VRAGNKPQPTMEDFHMRSTHLMCTLVVFFGLSIAVFGQTTSGSISGSVSDAQGAIIPGASVTATEESRKFTLSAVSDETGRFVFAQVPPGTYTISIELAGFKRFDRKNIVLSANDRLVLGTLKIEVGQVTDSVSVTAEAVLLKTESAERSDTLVARQIENIGVNGRSPLALMALVPGVVATGDFRTGGPGGLGSISANGSRNNQNQYTINGISNVDTGSGGSVNVTVSQDSVQEFKVLAGVYQAEYGRSAGSQITVVTKTGTSEFHGSGYWFHRHDSLNANTWLNNRQGLPRGLQRFNDVGYTIGGPIKKDKLFFFFSQEYQRQLRPQAVRRQTVATALERNGDFSQSVDSSGKPFHYIKDPLSTEKCKPADASGPEITAGCFSDGGVLGRIPASRLYQPGLALLKMMPLPNAQGNVGFNIQTQISDSYPRREDLARLDYNMSSKSRFFGHFLYNSNTYQSYYGSFVLGATVPITPIMYKNPGHGWAVGHSYTINSTTTNEFNIGATNNSIDIDATTDLLTRTKSGAALPLLYPDAVQKDYVPNFTYNGSRIANSPGFGTGNAPFVNYNTTIDITDSLSKVWGRHLLKTGIFMQRSRKDQTSFANSNGNYDFGDEPNNPYDTGYGIANVAVGVYKTFNQANSYINGQYRYWNIEGYAQDTWKIHSKLTLDYGLRVAWYQPQYDASLQASAFQPGLFDPSKASRLFQPGTDSTGARVALDPITNTILAKAFIGVIVPNTGSITNGILLGKNDRYLMANPKPVLGPRVGIAWDISGKQDLVLRAGAGAFYDRYQGNRIFDMVRNPPESVSPTLNYGFMKDINPSTALLSPPTLYGLDPGGKVPVVYNYTLGIQSKLPMRTVLDVAYVGSVSRHLQDNRNLNPVPYGATFQPQNQDPTLAPSATLGSSSLSQDFLRPYRGFGSINLYEGQATSNYNSLQVTLQRRAISSLFFGASYTWSKALGTASADSDFVRIDQYTRLSNYSPTTFDRRHNFAVNYVYTLPNLFESQHRLHAIVDGWQLSGATQRVSGDPITPGFSISGAGNAQITGSFTEAARIVLVGNPQGSGGPYNQLNAAAFAAPKPGSLGLESGLRYVTNPPINNWNMSLQKNVTVAEKVRMQFRVDAFNVFNHPQFSAINSTLNFASLTNPVPTNLAYDSTGKLVNPNGFGTVRTSRDGRVLQTAVRIQF